MPDLIYTTRNGTEVLVDQGSKSGRDFIVRYREPGKRVRTPQHVHLIIDLYMKKVGNKDLTMQLVDHIIGVIRRSRPVTSYPPRLQFFSRDLVAQYAALDRYGEYPTEFLLIVTELIMLQERTNYPNGVLNLNLFQRFREEADIFSVVSAATFRG